MARKISFDAPLTRYPAASARSRRIARARSSGLNARSSNRAPLGAISHSLGDISEKVKRAEDIEQKLIEGQVIVDLDPALIDTSFVPDRMEATEEQNAAFREIIRQHGQNVPILVRPKPAPPSAMRSPSGTAA